MCFFFFRDTEDYLTARGEEYAYRKGGSRSMCFESSVFSSDIKYFTLKDSARGYGCYPHACAAKDKLKVKIGTIGIAIGFGFGSGFGFEPLLVSFGLGLSFDENEIHAYE